MSLSIDDSRIVHVYIRDKVEEYIGLGFQNVADVGILKYGTQRSDDEEDVGDDDFIDSSCDLHDNERNEYDNLYI